ncbi:hypothetical protein TIFTF001_032179 [Ficus carica]|uniref:Uncharacterized protein n=1 Tax=Ficus carica TaxID=3494 RepID=A0AA88DWP9_FICCA|nr:hypothetical protein TIFTF001_032179 [Ficus carica]
MRTHAPFELDQLVSIPDHECSKTQLQAHFQTGSAFKRSAGLGLACSSFVSCACELSESKIAMCPSPSASPMATCHLYKDLLVRFPYHGFSKEDILEIFLDGLCTTTRNWVERGDDTTSFCKQSIDEAYYKLEDIAEFSYWSLNGSMNNQGWENNSTTFEPWTDQHLARKGALLKEILVVLRTHVYHDPMWSIPPPPTLASIIRAFQAYTMNPIPVGDTC